MLELYEPHIEDLWFKEKMMDDEQTMAYNHAYGGTIPFPKEKWTNWHQRWIKDHSGKRFYRYIQDNDAFVGEVAYYFDEERQIYIADVVIYAPYRGKGYGRKALQLLCEIAKENGIRFEDVIERSITRIPMYDTLNTIKIDTNGKTVAMIANEIKLL